MSIKDGKRSSSPRNILQNRFLGKTPTRAHLLPHRHQALADYIYPILSHQQAVQLGCQGKPCLHRHPRCCYRRLETVLATWLVQRLGLQLFNNEY